MSDMLPIIVVKIKKYKLEVCRVNTHDIIGGGFAYISEPPCGHEECKEKFMDLRYPDGSPMPTGVYHINVGEDVIDEFFMMDEPEKPQ